MPYDAFGTPLSPAGTNLTDLPANVPINQLLGIPAPDQQAAMIAQIKAMANSNDPKQRDLAQRYMDAFGRNMFMVGLNRATALPGTDRGFSDNLMTGQVPGLGAMKGAYSPEALAYAKALTKEVRPGEYHGAEMAGTAASLSAPYWLPKAALALKTYLGGGPGTPPPLSPGGGSTGPLIPEPPGGDQPILRSPGDTRPFGYNPKAPAAEEPPPKVVQDLKTWGPEPPRDFPPDWEPQPIERNYNKALDQPGTVGKREIRPMRPADLRKLLDDLAKRKKQ